MAEFKAEDDQCDDMVFVVVVVELDECTSCHPDI